MFYLVHVLCIQILLLEMIYAKKNPEKYVLFALVSLVFSRACSEYLFGAIDSKIRCSS